MAARWHRCRSVISGKRHPLRSLICDILPHLRACLLLKESQPVLCFCFVKINSSIQKRPISVGKWNDLSRGGKYALRQKPNMPLFSSEHQSFASGNSPLQAALYRWAFKNAAKRCVSSLNICRSRHLLTSLLSSRNISETFKLELSTQN